MNIPRDSYAEQGQISVEVYDYGLRLALKSCHIERLDKITFTCCASFISYFWLSILEKNSSTAFEKKKTFFFDFLVSNHQKYLI